MLTKTEQLKRQRRIILRGFQIAQLEDPKTAEAIANRLEKIDQQLTKQTCQ